MTISPPIIESQEEKKTLKASQDRENEFDKMIPKSPEVAETELPFHVLGFNSQRHILIWHKGKILPTPVSQLRPDDLKLLVGNLPKPSPANIDKGTTPPNPYSLLKDKIVSIAHAKGLIDDEEPIKSGIWKFKNEWVIVSGKRAGIIKEGKFSFLEEPLINNRTIEFERSSWIDLKRLEKRLENPDLSAAFDKVKLLVSQWQWAAPSMVDYVSAFIMLNIFQYAMKWRPWLYLLGAAHTGKSSFIEYVVERLLGCLVKRLDKSTGHATAQAIGGSGRIPIFDEFEKNKHMTDVLETMKLANRGGVKTSGTTGDKPKEFSLHHMPLFASIYLPRTFSSDQAQLSRVVKFELKRVPEGKSIIGLSDDESQDLLCEIVASLMSAWPQIESAVHKIECEKESYIKECGGKISSRTVENFMYAMASLSIVTGKAQKIPSWAISEVKDDGENILESIIMAKVKYMGNEYLIIDLIHKSLGEIIGSDLTDSTAKDLLRNNGLSVVQKPSGWCLAIRCKDAGESLFKFHSDYQNVDISAPLERLDGAEKSIKTEWGKGVKQRALHIPGHHINALTGDD